MKIANFEVAQKATSAFSQTTRMESSIHVFKTPVQPPQPQQVQMGVAQGSFIELSLSEESLSLQETEVTDLFHLSEEDQAKIRLLESFISAITGKKFKFQQVVKQDEGAKSSEPSSQPVVKGNQGRHLGQRGAANGQAGGQIGIRITQRYEMQESERMTFSSKGVVKTADGQTIAFKVNLDMQRSYAESSETLIEIGAKLQDPLVINFDGKGIAFGEDSIELDLTFDGTAETFKNLASGNGFLALDKNGNGSVDDGGELFGPETGSGFGELSTYDGDQNGWIDESDAIFSALKIWTVSPSGEKSLIGLKEADVGAIYLGKVASEFHVKSGAELLGKIRESSIYLKESGGAGTVHEIDLKI